MQKIEYFTNDYSFNIEFIPIIISSIVWLWFVFKYIHPYWIDENNVMDKPMIAIVSFIFYGLTTIFVNFIYIFFYNLVL